MTITSSFHDPKKASHARLAVSSGNDSLQFNGDGGEYITLFVPPHVAEHTAAAFNRAMQAVPDRDAIGESWTYTTKSGVWHLCCPMPRVYTAQHDEITGDGDPAWMFADADSLIGCLDAIDATETENSCTKCFALVGEDNTTQIGRDQFLCADCVAEKAEHERGMAEMAADDKAHAAMERAAGL